MSGTDQWAHIPILQLITDSPFATFTRRACARAQRYGWGTTRRTGVAQTGGVIASITNRLQSRPRLLRRLLSAPPILARISVNADTRSCAHSLPRLCKAGAALARFIDGDRWAHRGRVRANDSDGTRAHIGRAAEVLDGRPGPRVNRKTSDRGSRQTPRGGFAASQSRRLPAHVDATSLSRSSSRTLLRHSTSASATFVGRSSTPARSHPIEERISEPVYPGTTKPIIMAKARRLGRC